MTAKSKPADALYPVSEKQADKVATPGGHKLDELTLANLLAGKLTTRDIGISPEALRLQAEVARGVGRTCLAENLTRGAELTGVPQEEIFRTYELLRPGRASGKQELLDLAARYRREFDAPGIARLIEDAADVYERRNLFRKRF